jgi:hypothetical protein
VSDATVLEIVSNSLIPYFFSVAWQGIYDLAVEAAKLTHPKRISDALEKVDFYILANR